MSKPSQINSEHFQTEPAAIAYIEALLWSGGAAERPCPHCGVIGESGPLHGTSTRLGVYKCYACRKPFTVRVGTIFESSHVPLHKWLQAIYLLCSSKKGMSSAQLSRVLGLTPRSAWFLSHRIRGMMESHDSGVLGGDGSPVQMDETYIWRSGPRPDRTTSGRPFTKKGRHTAKRIIVAMVEHGGEVRSFHVPRVSADVTSQLIVANISPQAELHTDESKLYDRARLFVRSHETVHHSSYEFARGHVTTNSVEGFFGLFKRGMRGVYQHCSVKHMHRYLREFDFRYNNRQALGVDDLARTEKAIKGAAGRRLRYRSPRRRPARPVLASGD